MLDPSLVVVAVVVAATAGPTAQLPQQPSFRSITIPSSLQVALWFIRRRRLPFNSRCAGFVKEPKTTPRDWSAYRRSDSWTRPLRLMQRSPASDDGAVITINTEMMTIKTRHPLWIFPSPPVTSFNIAVPGRPCRIICRPIVPVLTPTRSIIFPAHWRGNLPWGDVAEAKVCVLLLFYKYYIHVWPLHHI